MIPRSFCVTLKETPLRTKGFFEMMKDRIDVEPFYGVMGPRMGLVPKLPNEIECPGRSIYLNEQAVGCNMSHFLLWNAMKYMPEDEFMVFEDDAVLCDDFFTKFPALYERLPKDWQMVFVGWLPSNYPPQPRLDDGISLLLPSGTHAYMVKKSILNDLCECMMPFQSNIDLTIVSRLLPKIRYYTFDPSLVSQKSYLNVNDSTWNSLVYDWKHDLYGCKRKILREIALGDGWHNIERNDKEMWRWSEDVFTFIIPNNIDRIKFIASTARPNTLVLQGAEKREYDLKVGDNEIIIESVGVKNITGRVLDQFIPKNEVADSQDGRILGICLKKIFLIMGVNEIEVSLEEI